MFLSDFEKEIIRHCSRLYNLAIFVIKRGNRDTVLSRRFLAQFQLESAWMEETMDAAGARKSERWFPFREGVSAIKMLTAVAYDLLHIRNSAPNYNLIKIEKDLKSEVELVLEDLYLSLYKTSDYIVKRANRCGIHRNKSSSIDPSEFVDMVEIPLLDKDRKLRQIDNPGKTLIYLATEFLNLKNEMKLFDQLVNLNIKHYKEYIPDYISEDKIRLVLVRFHNLQSLYDTYLSESDIEDVDPRLRVLRGHISIIYHMIKSATKFTHYYERHIVPREDSLFFKTLLPMDVRRFIDITVNFFMCYPVYYFNAAKKLCFKVIESYAEIEEKLIPIPPYRGFHVRPSTLVSKIIQYYGGKVRLEFNGIVHDPSTTLELFRLNEDINAQKRKRVMALLNGLDFEKQDFRKVLGDLESRSEVIVYDRDWDDIEITEGELKCEYFKRAISLLLASGHIDIKMDLNVKFIGDKRSLSDIEILAKSGYGEDKYGKNIPLPPELSYLKR